MNHLSPLPAPPGLSRAARPARLLRGALLALVCLVWAAAPGLAQTPTGPVPPTPPVEPQAPEAQPPVLLLPGSTPVPLSVPDPLLNELAPPPSPAPPAYVPPQELARFTLTAQDLWRRIQRAYPDFVADLDIRQTAQGPLAYLRPLAGEPLTLLDRQERNETALWESPSLGDTLLDPRAAPYRRGQGGREPAAGFSPGRARSTPFLQALYGATEQEVRAGLESVDFLGSQLPFNSRHGAAAALRRVVQRLERHLAEHPEDRAYLLPPAGTFNPRRVAGSQALSPHAFGIAIDLNAEQGPYWRWRPSPETVNAAKQNFPQAIVDAFEAEGFIWGGKWSHYDFMHFEYRPEL